MKKQLKYYLSIIIAMNLVYTGLEFIHSYWIKIGTPFVVYYTFWLSDGRQHGSSLPNFFLDLLLYIVVFILANHLNKRFYNQ